MPFTEAQLEADIVFLLRRIRGWRRGSAEATAAGRDNGVAADALVRFAYGGARPLLDEYPHDADDLAACIRAFDRMPAHRRGAPNAGWLFSIAPTGAIHKLILDYGWHVEARQPGALHGAVESARPGLGEAVMAATGAAPR